MLGWKLHDFSRPKAGLSISCELRLHANNFGARLCRLNSSRDSADQAASAYWDEDKIDVTQVLQNFQAGGPLPGDNLFIVIGRNDDVAVLCRKLLCLELALRPAGTDEDDLRAQSRRGLTLDR